MAAESVVMVSVSGVRGIIGRGLSPELATAYASALAVHARLGRIVLARDSRPSGAMLRHAVLAGLTASGCDVIDLGVVPTPICGRAVTFHAAAGGVMITASHNPSPWNGLKLFGPDGGVLSAEQGRMIQSHFEANQFQRVTWDGVGTVETSSEAAAAHLERVIEMVDADRIRSKRIRVFLDANRGAGGEIGMRLLAELGCEVVGFALEPDGRFDHEPEPIPENLKSVGPMVPASGAEIGFVLDPDADRLAILDETGRPIGEELTLALAVKRRLSQTPGPIAANMSTSRILDDLAARAGMVCHRTAVGEANVVAGMRHIGAVIGGEGNGGVIDPRVGWVRDPFIGMAMILDLIAQDGRRLSEIVAELPAYAIVKDKATVNRAGLENLYERLVAQWPAAIVNRLDGMRLDWPDRWLHVRPSNTEPIVRFIAEAPTAIEAQSLCDAARVLSAS